MAGMNIDLHLHSSFSDGAFTPTELVARARQNDVAVIAIADHDSVAGIGEGVTAGKANGVNVLTAVELSVQFGGFKDVHLLGYGFNSEDVGFLQQLNTFRQRRKQRNDEILARVNEMLRSGGRRLLEPDEVQKLARDTIGRPHIARVLLEREYVSTIEEAFQRYLVPCNVPKIYWPIEDAVSELHRIGGVAVLAHPTTVTKDVQELKNIIVKLLHCGLDGIEVFNNMALPQEIEFLRRLAGEYNVLMTAGSDFHGLEEGLEIGTGREGIRFDSDLLPPLYERIQFRRSVDC